MKKQDIAGLKKPNKKGFVLPATVFILVWLGADLYYSNRVLQMECLDVSLERLPKAFDGYKIIHLSDLHQTYFGENNHLLLQMIEKSRPDMIAITGDLIDSASYIPYAKELCDELLKIAPVYYVTGNHEWGGKTAAALKKQLSALGVFVLANDYSTLTRGGETICIGGLEDPNGPRDMKTISEVMRNIREDMDNPFVLMLSHRYDRFDEYIKEKIDLVLSGHAHGGLIRFPFTNGIIGPGWVVLPKHTNGVNITEDCVMVVSRGMRPGLRLFNRMHVLEITLKSKYG